MYKIPIHGKDKSIKAMKGLVYMKDVTKKVVILENLASPFVHQAIIVMRDYNPKLESYAVAEAERIVAAYLDDVKIRKKQPSKKTVRKNVLMLCFIVAAAAVGAYLLITHP